MMDAYLLQNLVSLKVCAQPGFLQDIRVGFKVKVGRKLSARFHVQDIALTHVMLGVHDQLYSIRNPTGSIVLEKGF